MGNFICFVYVVIFLKIWSYVHVNYWCRLSLKSKRTRAGVVTGTGTFDGRMAGMMATSPHDDDATAAAASAAAAASHMQPKSNIRRRDNIFISLSLFEFLLLF